MDTMNMFKKDELTILKNTSAKYQWVARDKSGALFVYVRKPKKYLTVYGDAGDGAGRFPLGPFEELFKEIKWEDGPVRFRKSILEKTERKYLKAVLRPFRNRVVRVVKTKLPVGSDYYLWASFEDGDSLVFPSFSAGAMYNGMEPNHEYTLEELGINY